MNTTPQPVFFYANLLLLVSLCFTPACFSNESVQSQLHPFRPDILPSKSYSEVYKLTTLYDDQTFIEAQMIITNVGLGDSLAACEILYLHAGDTPVKTNRRYKRTDWNYSDAPNPSLSIGRCRLSQKAGSIGCDMDLDGADIRMSLDLPQKSSLEADTVVADKVGRKFCVNEVLVPWTHIQTILRLPGSPQKVLQGVGTLEHSRSVGYPKDFSRGWISFYGCCSDTRFLANFHFPTQPCSGAIGWTWTERDASPKPMSGLQTVMKAKENCLRENSLPVVTAPKEALVISGEKGLFRFSVIDDLGPFLGSVCKLVVGNPVTRFYWAQAQVKPGQKPIEGVLEIMNFE